MRTLCPIPEPRSRSVPPPHRTEVAVIGGGISGLEVAHLLHERGIQAHVFEQQKALAGGMATRGMGVASTLLLDPPFRLIQAVGEETARAIYRFAAEGVVSWGDRLEQEGLIHAPRSEKEAEEVVQNLRAMERLGISAEAWTSDIPGLLDGWRIPTDGTVDLGTWARSRAAHLPHTTSARVVAITDAGSDLCLTLADGRSTLADLVVMTGGAQLTGWAGDKFYSVRHQALATAPVEPLLIQPMSIQYGYTLARQLNTGSVVVSGCRWATPHLEVGEDDDTVISEAVNARLEAVLRQHWPMLQDAAITHRWTSIMTFSCDGLPIIGPLPGRPRIIACGGFGGFSPTLAPRAARAVVDGILTGESPGVPASFFTRRFD